MGSLKSHEQTEIWSDRQFEFWVDMNSFLLHTSVSVTYDVYQKGAECDKGYGFMAPQVRGYWETAFHPQKSSRQVSLWKVTVDFDWSSGSCAPVNWVLPFFANIGFEDKLTEIVPVWSWAEAINLIWSEPKVTANSEGHQSQAVLTISNPSLFIWDLYWELYYCECFTVTFIDKN